VLTIAEDPNVQEIQTARTPTEETTTVERVVASPIPNPSSLTFPVPQPQRDHSAVGINELSAGLGLPAIEVDTIHSSPATSHKSRLSQAHPGALYGKLISRALDKPLTAKGLAEYLQNQDIYAPFEVLAPPSSSSITTVINQHTDTICPPPGFGPFHGLENATDTPRTTVLAPIEVITVPKGPFAFQHQHRRSSGHSSTSFQHHARNPSNKRYPRRTSRAKRMDQGPMPSAADIYPDDANWTPSAPIHEGFSFDISIKRPRMIINEAFHWPTPAEVYTHKPESAPTSAEQRIPPTAADVNAADNDVLTLLDELPEPSLNTLVKFDTTQDLNVFTGLDLPCDSRALTPGQLDGSKYGMRFYGIALGDEWECTETQESEHFRARPREHESWGGWSGR
jgi:hypothetical protein